MNSQKYQHYKGGLYEIVIEAKHSESMEDLIVYRSIEDPTKVWARPKGMFFDNVEIDSEIIPRFRKITD